MKRSVRIISIVMIMLQTLFLSIDCSLINFEVNAVGDAYMSQCELNPSFSALTVDISEPLIISYENIDLENYECSIDAEGVNVSITDDIDYLQCEIEANDNVEFGTFTVRAVALDGTELTDTIYTYNNGEKLFYSEFAKDQAWYDGTKELFDKGLEWYDSEYHISHTVETIKYYFSDISMDGSL